MNIEAASGLIRDAAHALLDERDKIAKSLDETFEVKDRLELYLRARRISRALKRLVAAKQILDGKEKP